MINGPRSPETDAGFTVVELSVVLLLLGFITVLVMGSLSAFVDHTRITETRTQTLTATQRAVETVAKDLRAANPIDAISGTDLTVYDSQVSFSVHCTRVGVDGCGSNKLRPTTYRVVDNRLERITSAGTRVILKGVVPTGRPEPERYGAIVNVAGEPVFSYFKGTGAQIATSGVGTPASSVAFRDCAKSVKIRIVARSAQQGQNTVRLLTKVDLRNFNEVQGC